jgi:outer membrane protein assembly factor BamB
MLRTWVAASLVFALLPIFALLPSAATTDQWPQFRGRHAGVALDSPALPDTWSRTKNVVWTLDVPGMGWSSPVVWDDVIFITAVVKPGPIELPATGFYGGNVQSSVPKEVHRWMVYAVDLKTGRIRWERELRRAVPLAVKHEKNTYASETPVTDGERVYAYFGGVGLFAFDMQGKPLWSKPMDPLKMRGWGTGASPIVHQNRVYIVNDNDEQSSLIAYDSRTGDVVWRVAREEGSNWSTPFIWEHALGTEIVTTGSRKVRSYSLDGKLKWELAGMTSLHVPTPFAIDGLLFISSGFLADPVRPVYAIRPGASGDISLKEGERSNPFVAWSNPRLGTYGTSGLVYGDYYYTLLDRGFLVCNDAKTGKEVYPRQRITAEASGFTASPWAYNGKIFALSEDGDTFVMQAGPEFKVLGRNSLGEMALATPAVAGDSLIIRTASKLYRISNKR